MVILGVYFIDHKSRAKNQMEMWKIISVSKKFKWSNYHFISLVKYNWWLECPWKIHWKMQFKTGVTLVNFHMNVHWTCFELPSLKPNELHRIPFEKKLLIFVKHILWTKMLLVSHLYTHTYSLAASSSFNWW